MLESAKVSSMTTLMPIRLNCPLCGSSFASQAVMSTNTFGRLHSDLYREASGVQPVCYFVHTCPGCGYTGYEGDFERQELGAAFRQKVELNITPEVRGRSIGTNGHYYLAALCAEWRGAPAHVLARIYHMGAWCCRIKDEREKERFYLGKAAEYFEKALASSDAPKENTPIFTYLLGDLYRRLGNAEKAKEWYSRVDKAIKDNGGDPKIGELARRQLIEPSDFFT